MEKFIRTVAVSFAAIFTLLFFSCQVDTDHEHTYSEAWSRDSVYHWHAATCGCANEVRGKANHSFGEYTSDGNATVDADGTKSRICSVCGYKESITDTGTKIPTVSLENLLDYIKNTEIQTGENALTIKVTGLGSTITGAYTAKEGTLQYAIQNGGKPVKIILPDSVTSIGYYAFYSCANLTSIKIPLTVTTISGYAFTKCTSLTAVTIPSSVTSIGSDIFNGCTNLVSINVDAGNLVYSSVEADLFNKDKTQLIRYSAGKSQTSYTIPSSVTSIGIYAFSGCASLTSVTIPSSVTSIGGSAFYGCTSLTSVTIPSSVTSIERGAFADCTSLTSVTIPSSVTSIGVSAFSDCTSLTSVTIPSSVTSIEQGAFYGCTNLATLIIPSSVTSIERAAFANCSSLTTVTIPSSVTALDWCVFANCKNLTSIYVDTKNEKYSSTDGVLFSKDKAQLVCYPAGKSQTNYIIPSSVTLIWDYAFDGCINLTSITIPSSITEIAGSMFSRCTNLTTISIPSSITSITDNFSYYTNLTSVTYSGSIADWQKISGYGYITVQVSCSDGTYTKS